MPNDLTTPAAEEYLASRSNIILATLRRDAGPQLSPVWFVWRDGAFYISTSHNSAKWRNLERDQRCSGIIDHLDGRYIYVSGVAELTIEHVPLEITTEIVRKYKLGDEYEPYMKIVDERSDSRGIIRLVPESIVTRELD
jgi:F420H(2)-dependent biliverdin reductase